MNNLYNTPLNKDCKVINIKCDGTLKRRLLDLGIVKGTLIKPVLKSPSGDPTAFEVRGSLIALRKEASCLIEVQE